MGKLHTHHHHIITIVLILIVLIIGIIFGVKLSTATRGGDGMVIITFALSFLSIVLSVLIFTQLIHLKEHIAKFTEASEESVVRKTRK